MGEGDGAFQRAQIDGDLLLILSVVIGLLHHHRPGEPAGYIFHSLFIHREDAVLGAGLDGHVCDGKAVVHGQLGNAGTGKFQGFVKGAVHADPADEVQDDILAGDIGLQLSGEGDLDGGGHLEPVFADGHAGGHVGGAHAGGEGA